MKTVCRDQYNVAKKTCLGIMAVVLFGVQTGAPAAMAAKLIPNMFENETEDVHLNDRTFVLPQKTRPAAIRTMRMDSTAYTSRLNETDASPFITADGSVVRDGYVATNVLPLGTKVRLPTVFGDKIFEVRDRMNPRYSNRIDVWTSGLAAAKAYGIKHGIPVEIIEMGTGKKNWEQWKGRAADLHKVGKYGPAAEPIAQPYIVAKTDDHG